MLQNNLLPALVAAATCLASHTLAVDFKSQVFPVLNQKCAECHSLAKDKIKGKFAIDRLDDMKKHVKAGEPTKSTLVYTVTLPDDDEEVMPPKGKNRLTPAEVTLLKTWIQEGASFEAGAAPTTTAAPAGTAPAGGILSWTNTDGKAIQAAFEGMQGTDVVLKMADGSRHAYPLSKLSPESQAQAKKLASQ
jgi:mono/diheme cytochrome c family protein